MDLIKQFPSLPEQVQQQILNGPAMMPPPGAVVNLENPPHHNGPAIVFGTLCFSLTCTVFAFRMCSRLGPVEVMRPDDFFGCLAMLFYIGSAVTFYLHAHFGGFHAHTWNLKIWKYQHVSENAIALPCFFAATMLFSKTAIVLEWTRIFVPRGKRGGFFWAGRVLIAFNVAVYITGIVSPSLSCVPLKALWTPWIEGKCVPWVRGTLVNKIVLEFTTGYFNLVMDAFIVLLPQKVIWGLQMTPKRKLGISVIFSVGILTIACAVARVVMNHLALNEKNSVDSNYEHSSIAYLLVGEETLVIFAYCVPALPKGFAKSKIVHHAMRLVRSSRGLAPTGRRNAFDSGHAQARTRGSKSIWPQKQGETSETELVGGQMRPVEQARGIVRRVDIECHSGANAPDVAVPSGQLPPAQGYAT